MTHVTCKLTAKNQDQLRNPALGNRVWVTFFTVILACGRYSPYYSLEGRSDAASGFHSAVATVACVVHGSCCLFEGF